MSSHALLRTVVSSQFKASGIVNTIIRYAISILLFLLISSCSLLGVNQWSAYKVTVDVRNETGVVVANVMLKSNGVKTQITDIYGRADLKFSVAGLHVVTITSDNKITKQIKISLPQDDNIIVYVVLNEKH